MKYASVVLRLIIESPATSKHAPLALAALSAPSTTTFSEPIATSTPIPTAPSIAPNAVEPLALEPMPTPGPMQTPAPVPAIVYTSAHVPNSAAPVATAASMPTKAPTQIQTAPVVAPIARTVLKHMPIPVPAFVYTQAPLPNSAVSVAKAAPTPTQAPATTSIQTAPAIATTALEIMPTQTPAQVPSILYTPAPVATAAPVPIPTQAPTPIQTAPALEPMPTPAPTETPAQVPAIVYTSAPVPNSASPVATRAPKPTQAATPELDFRYWQPYLTWTMCNKPVLLQSVVVALR
ncbi:hypothetical protein SNE40_005945 [Patella caerulea]|uniref:Uncharacterized protein n=1 Tax=Patella caerulea TaxID=87958 RepID=A0AAN8PZB4_PATCE